MSAGLTNKEFLESVKTSYLSLLKQGINSVYITNSGKDRKEPLFCLTVTRTQLEFREQNEGGMLKYSYEFNTGQCRINSGNAVEAAESMLAGILRKVAAALKENRAVVLSKG